eukprot:1891416-Lingulodinium_polyedra.AAC.1
MGSTRSREVEPARLPQPCSDTEITHAITSSGDSASGTTAATADTDPQRRGRKRGPAPVAELER